MIALLLVLMAPDSRAAEPRPRNSGVVPLETTRPERFPHRIWAACDFERRLPDYAWFGPAETQDIPEYPGNATVLGVKERPYQKFAGLMTGINPVPGPMMGEENSLYLRYLLTGATEATFQHFSLTTEDNNHVRVTGLAEGKWSEATIHFSRDARRNDGTPGVPFKKGERMDDLKIFVGRPEDSAKVNLVIDDVIFFANDPKLPPEPEPFPRRVLFLAAFDTGTSPEARAKYWKGDFDLVAKDLPADSYWGVARSVQQPKTSDNWIRLVIDPTTKVGAHTKLRFRYHLTGAERMTVQIFDATDQDNRHVKLANLKPDAWQTAYIDLTKDARRNDGSDTPFAAGHVVDDLFFFVRGDENRNVQLLIDEVVLFDAQ